VSLDCIERETQAKVYFFAPEGPDGAKLENHISRELALPVFRRGREINRWISDCHPR